MKLDFLLAGAHVKRYHTVDTITTDTVGRHSHGVAMMVYRLMEGEPSVGLLMAALVHDLGEQAIGDIPSPTKRALGAAMSAIDAMEDEALREQSLDFLLSDQERAVLKVADCADGMLFCIRERRLGNKNVCVVFDRFKSYILKLGCVNTEAWFLVQELTNLWEEANA